jgi:hypothetical protein
MSNINKLLTQCSEFVKLALDSNISLQERLYYQVKQAAIHDLEKEKYRVALQKAADALYDSDFLTDEHEKRMFLKKAMEDPVYIVRTLEKVCEAADVAQIGKPARVAARPKEAEYDPVMAAAFGYDSSKGIIDD